MEKGRKIQYVQLCKMKRGISDRFHKGIFFFKTTWDFFVLLIFAFKGHLKYTTSHMTRPGMCGFNDLFLRPSLKREPKLGPFQIFLLSTRVHFCPNLYQKLHARGLVCVCVYEVQTRGIKSGDSRAAVEEVINYFSSY